MVILEQQTPKTAWERRESRPARLFRRPQVATAIQSVCPFADCPSHQTTDESQIVVHQQYSGQRGDILKCQSCGRTFANTRGSILFKSHLPKQAIARLQELFRSGTSIRQASQQLSISRITVRRYYRLFEDGLQD